MSGETSVYFLARLVAAILVDLCTAFVITCEPRHEKTNVLVFDQVRHKPGCTVTEDGYMLETSDIERRGIVLSM